MRLDKWLWAVRLCKTRTLAVEAINGGRVKVNGRAIKPAHEVKPGEEIALSRGVMTRTVRALAAPPSRVGAKLVPQFAEELTPPEEWEKQRAAAQADGFRDRGTGRPTKHDRRAVEELMQQWETEFPGD